MALALNPSAKSTCLVLAGGVDEGKAVRCRLLNEAGSRVDHKVSVVLSREFGHARRRPFGKIRGNPSMLNQTAKNINPSTCTIMLGLKKRARPAGFDNTSNKATWSAVAFQSYLVAFTGISDFPGSPNSLIDWKPNCPRHPVGVALEYLQRQVASTAMGGQFSKMVGFLVTSVPFNTTTGSAIHEKPPCSVQRYSPSFHLKLTSSLHQEHVVKEFAGAE